MKIAIIGGGVSGMVSAWLLSRSHQITLFEADRRIGGHTHTIEVAENGHRIPVDTGFVVFNEQNYPNFVRILDRLGVESQPTSMSFSVSCEQTGLEYNGTSLNRLFAQRRNLLRPSFWTMLKEIWRFNREGRRLIGEKDAVTLGSFLTRARFSEEFLRNYLVPLSASIWSARPASILDFPARFLARFLHNHGMLQVTGRPKWRVICGGSQRYVERMIRPFENRIRLSSPVQRIRRLTDRVEVRTEVAGWESFDQVVLALHSDQALGILADPSPAEREILGNIPYQRNRTALHTDEAMLPRQRRAWASWNYHLLHRPQQPVAITYHCNSLQRLSSRRNYCVTLNRPGEIRPAAVIQEMDYHHPAYSVAAVEAQQRHREISGVDRTHYCGAYWGYGFHEDGVRSALRVCAALGEVF